MASLMAIYVRPWDVGLDFCWDFGLAILLLPPPSLRGCNDQTALEWTTEGLLMINDRMGGRCCCLCYDASTTTRLHTNSFEATTNRRLREDDLAAYVGGIIIHSQKRRRIQLLRLTHNTKSLLQ